MKLPKLLSTVLIVVSATILVILASFSLGYSTRKLNLNDSGVWVTNDAELTLGRVNKSALGLDAWLDAPGGAAKRQLEVFQDANAVVQFDAQSSVLVPIRSAAVTNANEESRTLTPKALVDMRGGTIAVLDPSTGKIWATRYNPETAYMGLQNLDRESNPLVELGKSPEGTAQPAVLSLNAEGAIFAVLANGKEVFIPVSRDGYGKPVVSKSNSSYQNVQLAAVGAKRVIYDSKQGLIVLPDGKTKRLDPDPTGVIQRGGPEAESVLIATSKGLWRVKLADGSITKLVAMTGTPAVPVRVGGCAFAAWSGATGGAIRWCGSGPVEQLTKIHKMGALVRPVFRVNREQILLNDSADGRTFDLFTQNRLDQWDKIKLKPNQDKQNPNKQVKPSKKDAKPVANPDQVGVRPGQSAIGYVLDNDTDALGQILMITEVSEVPTGASVKISADGQTLAIKTPRDSSGFKFNYTISNGSNSSSSTVTVKVISASATNHPPRLRDNIKPETYSVASFGTLPMSVLGNWRDEDGDALAVVSADVDGQLVPVTAEGRIEFTAGRETSRVSRTLTYRVSDSLINKPVEHKLTITILEASSLIGTPPTTRSDSVRGEVGRSLTFNPLDNDIPGSDPRTPDAQLRLGDSIKPVPGLKITTDTNSGQVTVTADAAGSFELGYSAAFGSSAMQAGKIRLDVVAASKDRAPIVMPDQITAHGVNPVRVDPLANDMDPDGGILTITRADFDAKYLDAAVLKGRWLIVTPKTAAKQAIQHTVHYTVTNGGAEAIGELHVTQLPEATDQSPIVKDDLAVVRAGDSVLVNPLVNDVAVNGEHLTLVTNLNDNHTSGELKVLDSAGSSADTKTLGQAFINNNKVRYVPPAQVDKQRQVVIEYFAQNPTGKRSATGHITVTINPLPAQKNENQAPTPTAIETRVTAGDATKIAISNEMQDPDGDSIVVLGLGSAPKLGRIVGQSPTSLTYEAFPNTETFGTDSFSFIVSDRFGKTSPVRVRVGVSPPGSAQPPIAIDDVMVAPPRSTIRVDALANDLYSRSDRVRLTPLAELNSSLPSGVKAQTELGPIIVPVPAKDAQPTIVSYALLGNGGTGPTAAIKVVAQEGYRNPPVIFDEVLKAEGQIAKANLLSRAWDPDGDDKKLKVSLFNAPKGAKLIGGELTVPLTNQPQIIPFLVTDQSGAASAAVAFAPSSGAAAPHLKHGGLIKLAADSSVTLNLADYVYSPRQHKVRFTPAGVFTGAPEGKIDVEPVGPDKFKVSAKAAYIGPASVTFQVMDETSITTEGVLVAYISVPVQVGPNTPVLRCPETELTLIAGGKNQSLDIASLCHVWAPNPSEITKMVFTAQWKGQPLKDVVVTQGHAMTFQAGGSAIPQAKGVVMIGIKDNDQVIKRPVSLRVVPAPPPSMSNQTFTNILQGTPVKIPLGIRSPLRDPKINIVKVRKISGSDAQVVTDRASITITPSKSSHGIIDFEVTASDIPDKNRLDRQVKARIQLNVFGVPDAPAAPSVGRELRSHEASLVWSVPADNGAPITSWVITSSQGKEYTHCNTNSCIITGLTNATPVKFKVQAVNKAGRSKDSPWSAEIIPDAPPKAPTGLKVVLSEDRRVNLVWSPAVVDGSKVHTYHIVVNGVDYPVPGTTTTTPVPMPDNNNQYQITMTAENKAGVGPDAKIMAQSAGKPLRLSPPVVQPVSLVGPATAVKVSWNIPDKNGPGPLQYTLFDTGDGKSARRICAFVTATSCTDDRVIFDGRPHKYKVEAYNNGIGAPPKHISYAATDWIAVGTPEKGAAPNVSATGVDQQVRVKGNSLDSRGVSAKVDILIDGRVVSTLGNINPRGAGFNELIKVPNNGSAHQVSFRVCNEIRCGSVSNSTSVVAFGPIKGLSIVDAGTKGKVVSYKVSVNPNGKPVKVSVNGVDIGTTGVGYWEKKNFETIGYGKAKTFTVTATDGSRKASSASVTLHAAQSEPKVEVIAGKSVYIKGACTSALCHYVIVKTSNFTQKVTCKAVNDRNLADNNNFFGSWSQDPNVRFDTGKYWGYPSLSVMCENSVDGQFTGTNNNWPRK